MTTPVANSSSPRRSQRRFATTRWSLVLQAQGAGTGDGVQLALAELCEAYWLPVYAFVRSRTGQIADAQDLTQAFFAELLSRRFLGDVQPDRGRFRAFLLAAVKHFLSNQRDHQRALKRGGGITLHSLDWQRGEESFCNEPVDEMTAERLFERQWALAVLERVLGHLQVEQKTAGRQASFDVLRSFLETDRAQINYAQAAAQLGLSTEAARVAVHRLRKRYRQLLRDEIRQTLATGDDVDDELQCLFASLS